MAETLKGQSYTTGTVHLARKVRSPQGEHLIQRCGASRRQLAYLAPTAADTPLTCKRCLGTGEGA